MFSSGDASSHWGLADDIDECIIQDITRDFNSMNAELLHNDKNIKMF